MRILASLFLFAAVPLSATMITAGFPTNKYGSLDQHKTDCPNLGCGPAAAVNSFVFLQALYPFDYESLLVPEHGGDPLDPVPNEQDMIGVANMLLGENFMNTDCAACGTYWGRFINGKEKYIEQKAPGKTTYRAQSKFAWDPAKTGTAAKPIAKPDYVSDKTVPTIDFLHNELLKGEDVEILLEDHYVTLTDLKWDTEDLTGKITFVDSATGKEGSADIAQGAAGDPISADYNGAVKEITVAISESPVSEVPEPSTTILLMAGLTILGSKRLARSRGR